MDVALSNIHFSTLDNFKMSCQTHKYQRFLQNYYKEKKAYIDIR